MTSVPWFKCSALLLITSLNYHSQMLEAISDQPLINHHSPLLSVRELLSAYHLTKCYCPKCHYPQWLRRGRLFIATWSPRTFSLQGRRPERSDPFTKHGFWRGSGTITERLFYEQPSLRYRQIGWSEKLPAVHIAMVGKSPTISSHFPASC